MTNPSYVEAVILGVVQGLTEFLPVSSSGHLAIGQRLLGLDPGSQPILLFDALAHAGTLIAVLVVFSRPASLFVEHLRREAHIGRASPSVAWRILLLATIATVATSVIGLSFKDTLESAFDKPKWIGVFFLVTGTLLAGTAWLPRGRKGWRQLNAWHALLIGVAQAGAILPGISRSGTTICVAMFVGLRRRWAAQFSFLLACPVIVGASILKILEVAGEREASGRVEWGPVLVGALVSMIVGIVALRLLLSMVQRGKLHYFALYCWIAGAVTLLTIA